MARFVLVHGAWHGGWCFGRLAEELESLGHAVLAPDLPCDVPGLTQYDYARVVGPHPDSIVVGHSLAGQTIPHIEAKRRVYLGALVPIDYGMEAFADGFGGWLRDGDDCSYWPDPDICAAKMYPDCSRAQSDWAYAKLRRQARIDAINAPFGKGDVVIALARDAAINPEWLASAARAHGAHLLELDTGHSPFITDPKTLAELLSELA
jgi:hypothetical protein